MSDITLTNVTKRFGAVTAVNNLNLTIRSGECFSMLGPSGCGKTTTLRMVAGFEDLDEGEISAGGRVISSKAKNAYLPPEKRGFGMVFQAFAVWPHLSVYENVAFPLRLKKLPAPELDKRVREALTHTNLLNAASGSPDDLSGGGKQRVALARALAMNPGVMLLDEPLSSLDPHQREEMRFEIKDLQRIYGFTILYVTHDQSEAMALSDRVMVMKDGVARQIGTPLEVYQNPADKFVFGFIGLSNFLDVLVSDGVPRVEGAPEPFTLPPGPPPGPPASVPAAGPSPARNASGWAAPAPPELAASGRAVLACRPSEIGFTAEGGIRGVVTRRTFLGEIVDYSVDVGGQEARVQTPRRAPGPAEGEACGLAVNRPHWYPASGGA